MTAPIILHLDKSSSVRGPHFERDGQPVSMEAAFEKGFAVSREDAPAVLTLIQNFLAVREHFSK